MPASLISIIIPHYNHSKELVKALESVFSQSYKNIEVIVVDDGSEQLHQSYLNDRIKPQFPQVNFIFAEHQGAASARNKGFHASRGEYALFWDADTVARPDMLNKMITALNNHPEASFAYSQFKFGWKKFYCREFDPAALRKLNYIDTTSLIHHTDFSGFDESLMRFQDWDLWLTMAEQGKKGVFIPEVLYRKSVGRRANISSWLPSFLYKIPFLNLSSVQKYESARKIILQKHHI